MNLKRKNENDKFAGFHRFPVSVSKFFRRKSPFRYWFVIAFVGFVFMQSCRIERNFIRLISIDTNNQSYIDTCFVKETITLFHKTYYCQYKKDSRR